MDVDPGQGFTYSVAREDETPARLDGQFDLDRAALNVSYVAPPGTEDPEENQRRVNLSIRLSAVYAFRDVNDNQRFDLGDEVLRVDPIEQSQDAQVNELSMPGSLEGAEATYPLDHGGQARIQVFTAPGLQFVDTRPVLPTDTELNVTLEGVDAPAEDARIALVMRVEAPSLEQVDSRLLHVNGDGARGVFSWADQAEIQNNTTQTDSTVLEQRLGNNASREEAIVVLATDPNERIQHEASLAVVHTQSAVAAALSQIKGDALLFGLGLTASLVLVGASAWVKLSQGSSGQVRDA